ncbi:ABC transporter ATP-binding protein [Methylocella tundrae]|uniref:ABC transporter-like protein n=1 Tax=Methylocella tundrae TaxID=227605 RepID=A0A4U8YVY3_METTU|nr:ATP-binding cassette domain-containing protein [Methylocella tundrae]WPP04713.1 ATP-binding cassette domain-containing protein [Methylocella tundrae]VFU06908.1 ABC transporter-like protein [Methylocella tundrae]
MLEVIIARKALRIAAGDSRVVLRDVAFNLKDGEVGALLGPSGCGKTTLLRIIAGLDHDFEGVVRLPSPHKIGMVFQEPRLLPWRTVAQNLLLAGATPGPGLDDILSALGLTEHLDHFPGELSLGLARRVAIARAFAVKPDLLLLDEPFVSLDAALALRLRAELLTLVEARKTMTLLVTHDVEEAIALADRIIILSPHPGRMVTDKTIDTPRLAMTPERAAKVKAEIDTLIAGAAG